MIETFLGARDIFAAAAQEENAANDMPFRGSTIQFTRAYREQLARTNPSVIIPGIVRRLAPMGGSYPLCIPSATNVRSVEIVEVTGDAALRARQTRQPVST